MKTWLKGGLIGLIIGYISYVIVYLFMKFMFPVPSSQDLVSIMSPSLLGSIPGFTWFIVYSLIFFIIGLVTGLIIQKVKK